MAPNTEEIHTLLGRLATFEVAHRLPKRRSSAAKKKAPATASWPHESPAPEELSNAGFYYCPTASSNDNVKCFHCEANVDGWNPNDNPTHEHLALSPDCAWAIIQNIRLRMDAPDRAEEDPMGEKMLEARIATFGDRWPHEKKKAWKPKVKKLAEAGWFYDPSPEEEDGVGCCYCGLSLDGWEPKDDPYDEHKRRSADCMFFILKEQYAQESQVATGTKKTKRSRAPSRASSRPSRASTRMSTQSSLLFSEPPSLASIGGDMSPPPTKATRAAKASKSTKAVKAAKTTKRNTRTRAKAASEDVEETVEDTHQSKTGPYVETQDSEMDAPTQIHNDEVVLPEKGDDELPLPASEAHEDPTKLVDTRVKDKTPELSHDASSNSRCPSSDIENYPPEIVATKSTTATPMAPQSRGTKRDSSGLAKPSWTPIDLDLILQISPVKARFGAATVDVLKASLSKEEMNMTVEQWIYHNASLREKQLKEQCERMVAKFEMEGNRAVGVLQALPTYD